MLALPFLGAGVLLGSVLGYTKEVPSSGLSVQSQAQRALDRAQSLGRS